MCEKMEEDLEILRFWRWVKEVFWLWDIVKKAYFDKITFLKRKEIGLKFEKHKIILMIKRCTLFYN